MKMELDEHDIQLIMLMKSQTSRRKYHVVRIWRDRCGDNVPANDCIVHATWRMADIVQYYNLAGIHEIMEYGSPDRFHMYMFPGPGGPAQKPWIECWFDALATVLMLSKVSSYPPGTFDGAQHIKDYEIERLWY